MDKAVEFCVRSTFVPAAAGKYTDVQPSTSSFQQHGRGLDRELAPLAMHEAASIDSDVERDVTTRKQVRCSSRRGLGVRAAHTYTVAKCGARPRLSTPSALIRSVASGQYQTFGNDGSYAAGPPRKPVRGYADLPKLRAPQSAPTFFAETFKVRIGPSIQCQCCWCNLSTSWRDPPG